MLCITEPANLRVKSVVPLKDGENLIGVRIIFENIGGEDAIGVKYAVVISTDETISLSNDFTVYEAKVDISAGGQKQIDLDGTKDIDPWIYSHEVQLPSGTYFIGAFIDSDDSVEDADETNNEGSSNVQIVFNQELDVTNSDCLVFSVDKSGMSNLGYFTLSMGPGDGAGASGDGSVNVVVDGVCQSAGSDNFYIYTVPLADVVYGSPATSFDKAHLQGIQFINSSDSSGARISGTLYFDDIHFE